MTFAKGDIVHPGDHKVITLPLTSGTITKGNFVRVVGGNTVALANAVSTEDGVFQAVETRVFASGSVENVQVVSPGTDIVVEVEGALNVGDYVVINDAGGIKVSAGTAANFAAGLVLGRYLKHAGENVASSAADGETDCIVVFGAA